MKKNILTWERFIEAKKEIEKYGYSMPDIVRLTPDGSLLFEKSKKVRKKMNKEFKIGDKVKYIGASELFKDKVGLIMDKGRTREDQNVVIRFNEDDFEEKMESLFLKACASELERVKKMEKKLLFVCNANTIRSPTFERWFKKNKPEFEVRSCGTHYGYPYQLTEENLLWADTVFVMDISQTKFIHERFPSLVNKVKIIGISDQYDPDEPELIRLINYWFNYIFI